MKFKCHIEEVDSGSMGTIYALRIDDDAKDELEKALEILKKNEIDTHNFIVSKFQEMINDRGFEESFFNFNVGGKKDRACRIEVEDSDFRLYCIRYDICTIICGYGDFKYTKKYQGTPKLHLTVETLRAIDSIIKLRIFKKEIQETALGLKGNLTFELEKIEE